MNLKKLKTNEDLQRNRTVLGYIGQRRIIDNINKN